jgi:DNA-binding GntR family transcriptional regulator
MPEDQREPYPFLPDVPRHVQIADVLRQRITDGKLAPRMPIPSEPHLTEEFGVARDTARKAVAILREQGYVHTVRGMGTFVRPRDEWLSR